MSQVKIQGNASGTGIFTVAAPNSNTDRTLTLPDSTGTVLNDQSDITAQVKTATNASGSAPIYSCRAWIVFNGTGTPAITASGNFSSITDNGTGSYTLNFTTALPDANYAVAISTTQGDLPSYNYMVTAFSTGGSSVNGADILVRPVATSDTKIDINRLCVSIFR